MIDYHGDCVMEQSLNSVIPNFATGQLSVASPV